MCDFIITKASLILIPCWLPTSKYPKAMREYGSEYGLLFVIDNDIKLYKLKAQQPI